MKRFLILFLLIGLVANLLTFNSANAITDFNVTVSPQTIGVAAEYKISCKFGATLRTGDSIYIRFDDLYTLPQTIPINKIRIYSSTETSVPSEIRVDGGTIALKLDIQHTIVIYEPVTILIYEEAGVVNPVYIGTYKLRMWTSNEQSPVEASYFIGQSGSGSLVNISNVNLSDDNSGKPSQYIIDFTVSQDGTLVGDKDDYIDVYFPLGTVLPSKPDLNNVIVNFSSPPKIEILGDRVRLYFPLGRFIGPGGQCTAIFKSDFGIVNPLLPGKYALQISTSRDKGLAISPFYELSGTSVISFTVSVDPTFQATNSKYIFRFKTSVSNGLIKDVGIIFIKFPKEIAIPSSIIPGAITVNSTPCVLVSKSSQTLSITTPTTVSNGSEVVVEISKSFSIVNPADIGNYSVSLYTSTDTSPVEASFNITQSVISSASVVVTPSTSGQLAKYNISFNTGAGGTLVSGIDKVNVIFPVGTTIPSSIQNSSITINNVPTTNIQVNGTTVTLTLPVNIALNGNVTIIISELAGIKNPVYGGNYRLYVNTTKETTSIQSLSYEITSSPVSSMSIVPQNPDGISGYYRTQPKVSFAAVSSVDPNPTIYYYFDTNQPTPYGGTPIAVPEGEHTLYYYAVDNQGHQEVTKSAMLKVDTINPQIVILSPQDGSIVNTKKLAVLGKVDAGCTVKVNGLNAEIDTLGNFSLEVEISSASEVINIVAMDPAGNSSSVSLTVSIDTTPPSLEVYAPVAFENIRSLPYEIKGKTEKGAIVTINGGVAVVSESGEFTYMLLQLNEGLSSLEVIAKDVAGNTAKKLISVSYVKKTIIILQINNTSVLINSQITSIDAAPTIRNSRTFVPVRFISEAFGANVEWDPVFQMVTITLGTNLIKLQVGKNYAILNGKQIALDASTFIFNSRTFVPLRFISEALGAEVAWEGSTKTVTIIYPKS